MGCAAITMTIARPRGIGDWDEPILNPCNYVISTLVGDGSEFALAGAWVRRGVISFIRGDIMKTIAKFSALGFASLGLVLGLGGCAEDNDKASLMDATGKVPKAVTPKDVPQSSAAAYEQQQQNDPMNSAAYKQTKNR